MPAVKFLKPKTPMAISTAKTLSATEKVAKMGVDYAAHALKPGDRVAIKENSVIVNMGVITANCLGLYMVKTDNGENRNYVGCQLTRIVGKNR